MKKKKLKKIIFLCLGIFFLLGAITMIEEDISATIFFGIIAIIFLFCGRSIVLDKFKKLSANTQVTDNNAEQTIDNTINNNNISETKNKIENEVLGLIQHKEELSNEIGVLLSTKKSLDIQLKNREDFFISTELKYIDSLDGISFENYTADMLQKLGYKTKVTKASQDNGGDIIAEKDNIKTIFQCKNYSSTVGNKAIQEVYSAKDIYQCDQAIVITNNYFTNQAQHEASILNVRLWNRDYIKMLLYQVYQFNISHIDTLKNIENNPFDTFSFDEDYEETDEFLIEAIDMAVDMGQISASGLQRRFKIGYSRAGNIIDQMEARGVITGYEGSKPRKVLITKEKWNELKTLMI